MSPNDASLFRCMPAEGSGGGVGSPARRRGRTIDLHCHALCVAVEKRLANHPERQAFMARMDVGQGPDSTVTQRAMLASVGPKLTDVSQRLADMDRMGVDVQVISPAPNQYYYWADRALADEIVSLQNAHIAALVAAHPDRLRGLGTVALQHPDLAVAQLDDAVRKHGLYGIEIGTQIEGRPLSMPDLDPVWAKAQELGCVVLVHPLGSDVGSLLQRHYLFNVAGQPLETTIALSDLIFGGVLDRHPTLKVCACHGGGYLPAYHGRSQHASEVRPEIGRVERPVRDYLQRLYYDSLVFDAGQLRHLIDTVGISQIVVGTDYPFDMGYYDVHGLIDSVEGLSDADRDAIRSGNAERLLTLTPP